MRARLIAAFAAVYVIWGSTYLAIRFAVQTLPPLLMASARFILAGLIVLLWARFRDGEAWPTRGEWRVGWISGALLLLGGNGGVSWAEQRVPSGIAALLVAVVPVFMVLLEWLRPGGTRPRAAVFVGVGLGLAGLVLLVGPGALRGGGGDVVGPLVLVLASLSWAAGSLYTKFTPSTASGTMATGAQMLAGGLALLAAAIVAGEPAQLDLAHVSTSSLVSFLYLLTFGSLIGFTAYVYLLAHTTAAKAATYAYVNPVVAVLLGTLFANEALTVPTIAGGAVILVAVMLIVTARPRPAPAAGLEPALEPAREAA
jgi:drug/metabolite transporter (DMT)-like permease